MKRFITLHARRRQIGRELFAAVREVLPEGDTETSLNVKLLDSDDRLAEAIKVLKDGGAREVSACEEVGEGCYWTQVSYEYELSDFSGVSLFAPFPRVDVPAMTRDEKCRLVLERGQIMHEQGYFGSSSLYLQAITQEFRDHLSTLGIVGVTVEPIYEKEAGSSAQPVLWHLTSDTCMPPVSPDVRLLDSQGNRVDRGDDTVGVNIYEDKYASGELRYLKTEVQEMAYFDIALTVERFGPTPKADRRRLVVSHKFKKACDDFKADVDWHPVFLD